MMTKKNSISVYGWNDEISLVHWVNLSMNRVFFFVTESLSYEKMLCAG